MLSLLAVVAALIGGLVTLWLAVDFWRDPDAAMRRATHRAEMLPRVMAGRYLAFTGLAVMVALWGRLDAILGLFAVFAFISFFDTWLYARAGLPARAHALAGAGALLVVALAAAAKLAG